MGGGDRVRIWDFVDRKGLIRMTQTIASPAAPPTPDAVNDLRDWLAIANEYGEIKHIKGADWNGEIGGLVDMISHQPDPPCLLFDEIKDYPAGYRLLANSAATRKLAAILLGLPPDLGVTELIAAWRERQRSQGERTLPVNEVRDGALFENVLHGGDIDLYRFPAPKWHERDGGRYLGTADMVITRDPDNGSINVGTYRMMIQDRDKIGLYISPGQHGRLHRDKYFARGEAMPVVAVFGMDPVLFLAASRGFPLTTNELEWAGSAKGRPVDVIPGPVTGLPIPAGAEIAIEGYVHPDRLLDEGPFGEFTGYYASA